MPTVYAPREADHMHVKLLENAMTKESQELP